MTANRKAALKKLDQAFDPTKMSSTEIFNLYAIAFSEFQTSAIRFGEASSWNQLLDLEFQRCEKFLDYISTKLDVSYQIRKLIDCASIYLRSEFSLAIFNQEYGLEKAQRYYKMAQQLLNTHRNSLGQYADLVEENIIQGIKFCDVLYEFVNPLKLTFSLLYKENKKHKPTERLLNPDELIEAENNLAIASEAAEEKVVGDRKSAMSFFLKIYYTWDVFFKQSRFNSFCDNFLKTASVEGHPLDNLFSTLIYRYRFILLSMHRSIKEIITKYYPDELIQQSCIDVESINAKNVRLIFTGYESILKDSIKECKTVRKHWVYDENLQEMFSQANKDQAADLKGVIEINLKLKSAEDNVKKKRAEVRSKQKQAFLKVLTRREKVKQNYFLIKHITYIEDEYREPYQFFLEGKFSEAIKGFKKFLPDDIKNAATFKHFKLLFYIAESYKTWAELSAIEKSIDVSLANQLDKLILYYKEMVLLHYRLAYAGFKSGLLIEKQESREEWETWCHLTLNAIEPSFNSAKFFSIIESKLSDNKPSNKDNNSAVKSSTSSVLFDVSSSLTFKHFAFNMAFMPWLEEIVQILIQQSEVYLLGGAVRDILLNRSPTDYDFGITGSLDQVRKISQLDTQLIGKKHPILKLEKEGKKVEVSALCASANDRPQVAVPLDNGITGYYRPAKNLYEDALLRDLTINSLYYDLKLKIIVDPTGKGLNDLYSGIIRTHMDPNKCFQTDPIIILRVIRYSLKLNFTIEKEMLAAILNNKHLLATVDPARILLEISKFIANGCIAEGIHVLRQLQLLEYIFPHANQMMHATASVSNKMVSLMLIYTKNPYLYNSYTDLPFFLAVMLWAPISSKVSYQKFAKKINYGNVLKKVESTLAEYEKILGLSAELKEQICKIWFHYLIREYGESARIVFSQKNQTYSFDNLISMDNFIALQNEARMQYGLQFYQSKSLCFQQNQTVSVEPIRQQISPANIRYTLTK